MPVFSKEFLDIQATAEGGLTLKHIGDTIRTYSQMHHTDNFSQHSSIILASLAKWLSQMVESVWPNS